MFCSESEKSPSLIVKSWRRQRERERERTPAKMTEDDRAAAEESSPQNSLHRDLETEITYALVFNWFVAWPLILVSTVASTIYISKHYIPYQFIDEIFHIPMTRQYYKGDFFSWDPKITTPPGLYYIGNIWAKLIKLTHLPVDPIGLANLRVVNTLGGTLALPALLNWLFILNPIGFWPSSIMTFPLLSTYYYLYYTDVWSTVLIVASLSFAIGLPYGDVKSVRISAVLGLLSVLLRQTNIIWNLFILVVVIERRAMIQKNFTDSFLNNCIKFVIQFFEDFYHFTLPYLINVGLFLVFLVYNRGITLGDKENHVAGLHIAQFFYCLTFITVFSWPIWLSHDLLKDYFRRYKLGPLFIIIEFSLLAIFIRFFTVVHPFLLADNRHYTFYIWKKIIALRWYTKYLMIPTYHLSIYVILNTLNTNAFYFNSISELPFKETKDLPLKPTGISIMALFVCIFLTVVPSPLFEPRYYIVPYVFFRLLVAPAYEPFWTGFSLSNITLKRLALELAWFLGINTFTTLVFTHRTFTWSSETELQRIIW